MRRPAAVVIASILLAIGAGACGSDDGDAPSGAVGRTTAGADALDAGRVLRATAEKGSAALALTARLTGFGLDEPVTVRGDGAADLDAPRMRFELDAAPILEAAGLPDSGEGSRLDVAIDGGTVQVGLPPELPLPLPGGADGVRVDLGEAVGALGVDAGALAALYRIDIAGQLRFAEVYERLRPAGTERVGGVRTTRYEGSASVRDFLDALPDAEAERALDATRALDEVLGGETTPLDEQSAIALWVDEDDVVRRQRSTVALPAQDGTPEGTIVLTFDFTGFGADVDLPPADGTFDATDALSDLLRQGDLAAEPQTTS